nr:ribonuclease H-like domain-containing protein [Tanacetum cinerariifolium]
IFGGNEATKKTKKNQLKQQYGNFKAEGTETLEQTFNRLQAIRNRSDLDTMSLDDLYNHLKVYEPEVQKKSESNSQNMAFISSAKNSSGKEEVNTASIPTASTQIKYEDINQIDEDDIEEMDIKWNMDLLSMRADRFWKKTGKKITIQGTDVAGFDKSKVKCFNCNKMGYYARECRAPRSQDRGRRENFKQGSKVEESAPKALEFALMAKSSSKNKELEELKKEKEGLDSKLTCFQSASKDLDTVLGSQRSDKNKEGLGYSVVPPPPLAQVYSSLKKDMSWTGLPKFAHDTITDYSKPSLSIESNYSDLQNSDSSIYENGESSESIMSKSMIKFVKVADSPIIIKTNKVETVRKPSVKYAKIYIDTHKSPKFDHLAYDYGVLVEQGKTWAKNNNTHKKFCLGLQIQQAEALTAFPLFPKSPVESFELLVGNFLLTVGNFALTVETLGTLN